jgi:hypothetical protein
MTELMTVEVSSDTRRRLEMMGSHYDLSGRDVLRFLIEQGLGVLEQHRNREPAAAMARSMSPAP